MEILNHSNMVKKIAFLSHYDFNLYNFRLPIMKELVKKGYKVYAISPKGEFSDKFIEENIEHIPYKINRKSLNPISEMNVILNIRKILSTLNIDILHTFTLKPNIYGSLASMFLPHRVICSITGLGSFYIDENLKSKIIKNITIILYKIISYKVSYFIFQNSEDKEMFVKDKIIKEKKSILIRGSGINTEYFNDDDINFNTVKEIETKINKQKTDLIITMIARVIIHKGVIEFIEAIDILKKKYPNIKAIFIGDKDNGNAFNLNIKQVSEDKNIYYFSFNNNIREFLFLSDLYVLPSYREGLSMSLLEASSMKKPIITTNVAGCRDVVDDGINGFLCEAKSSESLALSIEKFINYKDKKTMGINSRKKAIKEFSAIIVVKKHLDLYEELI